MKTDIKTFVVYELQRQEYNKTFNWLNDEECEETVTYTGKVSTFLGANKGVLLGANSIPEWKAEITAAYLAEHGHTSNGVHKYDISRNAITILQQLSI